MKIKLVAIIAIVLGLIACENEDNIVEDFSSTSLFFPYQTPVRTLILGDYDLGFNDNDNNGRFEIGVAMSGVFENKIDRRVNFELAPELIDANILGVDSVNVQVLPTSYYTIEQEGTVTIPAGSINGRIPIQLEDAFFDDPLAYGEFGEVHYVIPLRITEFEGLDSLLTGVPIVDNPIKILNADWNPAPKDYTLFGIKFINKYTGVHLRRGGDSVEGTVKIFTAASGETETIDLDTTSVYNQEFVVRDELAAVTTSGRNKADVTNFVRRGEYPSERTVSIEMLMSDNEDITITSVEGDRHTVTGSGKWLEGGDEWGGEKRNVFYIECEYRDIDTVELRRFGRLTSAFYYDLVHKVKDTLVFRNKDIKFEEFIVELTNN